MRKREVRWLVVTAMGLSFMLIALPSTARERRGTRKRAKETQAESKQPEGAVAKETQAESKQLEGAVAKETQAESKQLEGVVATVNGKVITRDSFDKELARIINETRSPGNPFFGQMPNVGEMALDGLIGRELMYQESQKEGIKAEAELVDRELAATKKRFSTQEEFDRALESVNLTEAAMKSDIARNMAMQQFVDEKFAKKIHISDEEIKAYYTDNLAKFEMPEQVRARHILVRVVLGAGEKDKAEALTKTKEIQKKLNKGGDFAALAGEVSGCPSRSKGGDLGYFTRKLMVKPFSDTAFAMKVGDVSDIVETRFGYHLIKVIDKKPAGRRPFKEVKEDLQQYLKLIKLGKEIEGFVSKLKETANIVRMLPNKTK